MESDYEVLELLNKLSSEICSKFDGIHFEINSMKSAISTLNKKIEKNTAVIDTINDAVNNISKAKTSLISDELSKNMINIDNNISYVKDIINSNCEALSNINSDAASKLTNISRDLKFLTHKILLTEKDLFNIQEELKNHHL